MHVIEIIRYSFSILFFFNLLPSRLICHGFGADTHVSLAKKETRPIKLVCEDYLDETQKICSFDLANKRYVKRKITSAATAQTNYYIAIRFNNEQLDDIICTPVQEFYTFTKKWVPACQLKVGDALFSKGKAAQEISAIRFVNESLTVYSIRVKKTHNFFVGRHAILTHNMLLVSFTAGLGSAFGSGAAAGGTAASFLGPVSLVAGLVFGGLLGMAVKTVFTKDKLPNYEINYDVHALDGNFAKDDEKQTDAGDGQAVSQSCDGSPGPPDPNDWWKKKKQNNNLQNKNDRTAKITNKMASEAAEKLGFSKTNYYSRGQAVFKKGKLYITADVDGHNGGFWKMADSVENLANKASRMGTYDQLLNRIGD